VVVVVVIRRLRFCRYVSSDGDGWSTLAKAQPGGAAARCPNSK
jgi:hypothetical protein